MRLMQLTLLAILLCSQASGFFWPRPPKKEPSAGSPVVIIPGTAASRLEARSNRTEVSAPHCPKHTTWTRVWLNVWQLLTGSMDCWSDKIKLIFDPVTGKSTNTPGVETRVPGFGHTATIEYLDTSWIARTIGVARYAATMVERLVSWGYERGVSVVGAPYDWRLAPHSQEEYFIKLQQLIEKTYNVNNRKKVTIFAHSLGSIFGLYFLNSMSQEWKDTYIQTFITAGGPWEGSAIEFQLYASGMNWGIATVDRFVIRHKQRTLETNMLMMPRPGAEWTPQDVFVFTPKRNYTAYDLHDFMVDIDFPLGNEMNKQFLNPKYDLKHPNVPFHCITSKGHPTSAQFVYNKNPNEQKYPKILKSDGDGTVHIRSLRGCKRMDVPGKFFYKEIDGLKHVDMLGNEEILAILKSVIYDNPDN